MRVFACLPRVSALAVFSMALLPLAPASAHEGHGVEQVGDFRYDEADRKIEWTMLGDDMFYDADILAAEDGGGRRALAGVAALHAG